MKNQSTKLPVKELALLEPVINAANNTDDMIGLVALLNNALLPNSAGKELLLGELEVNGLRVILDILMGELNSIGGTLAAVLEKLRSKEATL